MTKGISCIGCLLIFCSCDINHDLDVHYFGALSLSFFIQYFFVLFYSTILLKYEVILFRPHQSKECYGQQLGSPLMSMNPKIEISIPDEEDANSSPAADQPWELVSGHAECFIQRTLLSWMHHHLAIGPGAVLGLGTNHHFIFFSYLIFSKLNMLCIYTVYT